VHTRPETPRVTGPNASFAELPRPGVAGAAGSRLPPNVAAAPAEPSVAAVDARVLDLVALGAPLTVVT